MLSAIQESKKFVYVNTLNEFTGLSFDSQTFSNLFSAHYYGKTYTSDKTLVYLLICIQIVL